MHSRHINHLLNTADKITNLIDKSKVRQLARDISNQTLSRPEIRHPFGKHKQADLMPE